VVEAWVALLRVSPWKSRSPLRPPDGGSSGNHRTRCDRLGDDPALLIVIPTSATDDARDFCAAPNNPRVVTDVDHNVHTTRDPKRIASMQARSAFGYVRSEHRLRSAPSRSVLPGK
jgi:hypothetical protein